MAQLNDPTAAAQLPFQPQAGLTAQSVEAAILEVYAAIRDAAAGLLVDGSVTKEKLAAQLLDRTYGGRIWASMDTPTEAHNPETDFPVGQLWLRPGFLLENLAVDSWTLSGGTAQQENGDWLLTTDGSQAYLSAAQSLTGGLAEQKVFVCLLAEELDDHLSSLTLYLNGKGHNLMTGGGVFETALDENGVLELIVQGQWPYAETEASVRLREFAVVNAGAVEAALPDYLPPSDWPALIRSLTPFDRTTLERQVFLQVQPGLWEQVGYEMLPVSRGGTGVRELQPGELLYGSGTDRAAQLEPGAEGAFLRCFHGIPAWDSGEQVVQDLGALRAAVGSYTGQSADSRTVQLPVAPKLLFLYNRSNNSKQTLLADGVTDSGSYTSIYNGESRTYRARIKLSNDALQFDCDTLYLPYQAEARHFNSDGEIYDWVALY